MINNFSSRLNRALIFAAQAHDGQMRKGGDIPYIIHPAAVSKIVSEFTDDEDIVIAGLFHDILEDVTKQKYGEEQIKDQFGQNVVDIVKGCTQPGELNLPWKQVKEGYLENMDDAPMGSILVIAADKIHNMASIIADHKILGEKIWDRFTAPRSETLWFYGAVRQKIIERKAPMHVLDVFDKQYNILIELE